VDASSVVVDIKVVGKAVVDANVATDALDAFSVVVDIEGNAVVAANVVGDVGLYLVDGSIVVVADVLDFSSVVVDIVVVGNTVVVDVGIALVVVVE